jgi:hypothetical protein
MTFIIPFPLNRGLTGAPSRVTDIEFSERLAASAARAGMSQPDFIVMAVRHFVEEEERLQVSAHADASARGGEGGRVFDRRMADQRGRPRLLLIGAEVKL